MTNPDPKKTNAPEATELHDEELGQVAEGGDEQGLSSIDYTEKVRCCHCGAEILNDDNNGKTCPVCGGGYAIPIGYHEDIF